MLNLDTNSSSTLFAFFLFPLFLSFLYKIFMTNLIHFLKMFYEQFLKTKRLVFYVFFVFF